MTSVNTYASTPPPRYSITGCSECGAGTANGNEGSTKPNDCADCGVGTAAQGGADECVICDEGRFATHNGSESVVTSRASICADCPAGYHAPSVGSVACTGGMNSSISVSYLLNLKNEPISGLTRLTSSRMPRQFVPLGTILVPARLCVPLALRGSTLESLLRSVKHARYIDDSLRMSHHMYPNHTKTCTSLMPVHQVGTFSNNTGSVGCDGRLVGLCLSVDGLGGHLKPNLA